MWCQTDMLETRPAWSITAEDIEQSDVVDERDGEREGKSAPTIDARALPAIKAQP
jgi:hypothetical protein